MRGQLLRLERQPSLLHPNLLPSTTLHSLPQPPLPFTYSLSQSFLPFHLFILFSSTRSLSQPPSPSTHSLSSASHFTHSPSLSFSPLSQSVSSSLPLAHTLSLLHPYSYFLPSPSHKLVFSLSHTLPHSSPF